MQKTRRLTKRLIRAGMLFTLASFAPLATAATVQQAGPNPIVIDQLATTDNITYLMAAAARREDTTSVREESTGAKHFWLQSISSSEPLEWRVQVSRGENFGITTLLNPSRANQRFRLEVVGQRGSNADFTVGSTGWQRHNSGTVFIPAGTHTLRFTRLSNDGDINLKSLELLATADKADYDARVASFKGDASDFSQYDYGIMFQYGGWGYPRSGQAKSLDAQARDFDVPGFVRRIRETGAQYIIWSASWWTFEFNAPLAALDNRVQSDRTSSRDLIGELATAFDNEGIDFFLYYHTGQDIHLGYQSTDWWRAQRWPDSFRSTGLGDKSTFVRNWTAIVSELGRRYGDRLDGWFFDDGLVYYPGPFEQLGAAAKAGNPDRLITYNSWIISHYTDFQDLAFGEHCVSGSAPVGGNGVYTSGNDGGLVGHCMHRMERGVWGVNSPNQTISAPTFSVASATQRVQDATRRNVPTSFNLLMYEDGTMSQASLDVMDGLSRAFPNGSQNGSGNGSTNGGGNGASSGTNTASSCGPDCFNFNNTTGAFTYNGNWGLSSNRNTADFGRDVHFTTVNGASVDFTFTGDRVSVFMPVYDAGGDFRVFLDGVNQGVFSAHANRAAAASNSQVNVYEVTGVSPGGHTLRLVKLNGSYLQIDKIEVSRAGSASTDTNAGTNTGTNTGSVVFYEHHLFGGASWAVGPGSYNFNDLVNSPVGNDAISSMRIPAGFSVEYCEHGGGRGECVTSTSDQARLVAFNDRISSVRITRR